MNRFVWFNGSRCNVSIVTLSVPKADVHCIQTEAYYAMKQQAEKQWRKNGLTDQQCWHTFTPCTNVQWIAYLAKILRYKRYKKHKGETYKGVSMTSKELSSLSAFMCVLSLCVQFGPQGHHPSNVCRDYMQCKCMHTSIGSCILEHVHCTHSRG